MTQLYDRISIKPETRDVALLKLMHVSWQSAFTCLPWHWILWHVCDSNMTVLVTVAGHCCGIQSLHGHVSWKRVSANMT